MSKLYIFDLGNVVIKLDKNNIKNVALEYEIDAKEFLNDWKNYEMPLMDGLVSYEDYIKHLQKVFKVELDFNCFSRHFKYEVNKEILDYVDNLRREGNIVVIGSNTFAPHYDSLVNSSLFDHFDNIYASHLMNCSKPHSLFFETIMDKENFDNSNTFFVDDLITNVEAAKKLGLIAYCYSFDTKKLKETFYLKK